MPAQKRKPVKKRSTARHQKKSPSSKLKKALIFGLVLFISIIFLLGIWGFNYLNKKMVRADSASVELFAKSYLTFVYTVVDDVEKDAPLIEKLEYRVLDMQNKKIQVFSFTPDFIINIAGKYGDMEVSKLYALGGLNSDNKSQAGVKFINDTMFRYFAFPVDMYVLTDAKSSDPWNKLVNNGNFVPVLLANLTDINSHRSLTNASLIQFYSLSEFVHSLPDERILAQSLKNDAPLQVLTTDLFKDLTISSQFAKDAESIAVLNGNFLPGVATFGADVISNLGGRVVSIGNSSRKFEENFIVTDNPESLSVKLLAQVFEIPKIIDKKTAKQYIDDTEIYRADIILILAK